MGDAYFECHHPLPASPRPLEALMYVGGLGLLILIIIIVLIIR
jgi:hypothetical protein